MAEDRTIVRPAQASDIPALKRVLQETFEGTWLPNITEAAAQRYIKTDIGGRYVDQSWPEFAVAEIDGAVAGLIHWRAASSKPYTSWRPVNGKVSAASCFPMPNRRSAPPDRRRRGWKPTPAQALYKAVGYIEKTRYPDDEWDSGFTTVLFEKWL
ncbi:GCN5 family acetyltransferase [Mesorhizobium sp. Root102]|nr:GCN5 family acetyltransferase [Mesorhizobium sp. Root102]